MFYRLDALILATFKKEKRNKNLSYWLTEILLVKLVHINATL